MNTTNIQRFLEACADLIDGELKAARTINPASADFLELALREGSLLHLNATFAPSTGLANIAATVQDRDGAVHRLMSCELQCTPLPPSQAPGWPVPSSI